MKPMHARQKFNVLYNVFGTTMCDIIRTVHVRALLSILRGFPTVAIRNTVEALGKGPAIIDCAPTWIVCIHTKLRLVSLLQDLVHVYYSITMSSFLIITISQPSEKQWSGSVQTLNMLDDKILLPIS